MKNELLHNFVQTLKENGFKVYTSSREEDYTYCHFVEGDNIGYVQTSYFGGLQFSTVHKPCKEFGTGFGLNEDGIYNPTIVIAREAFVRIPIYWQYKSNTEAVKKYKNWEEYINTPINRILKEREL